MLSSLVEIKVFLGISDDSQDTLLNQLSEEVDNLIKKSCGREFEFGTYTKTIRSDDFDNPIFLKEIPIDKINSIKIDNEDVTENIDIFLNNKTGELRLNWLAMLHNQKLEISYEGGYNTIPAGLKSLFNDLVAYKYYKSSKDSTIDTEKIDSLSIKYNISSANNLENAILNKVNKLYGDFYL